MSESTSKPYGRVVAPLQLDNSRVGATLMWLYTSNKDITEIQKSHLSVMRREALSLQTKNTNVGQKMGLWKFLLVSQDGCTILIAYVRKYS